MALLGLEGALEKLFLLFYAPSLCLRQQLCPACSSCIAAATVMHCCRTAHIMAECASLIGHVRVVHGLIKGMECRCKQHGGCVHWAVLPQGMWRAIRPCSLLHYLWGSLQHHCRAVADVACQAWGWQAPVRLRQAIALFCVLRCCSSGITVLNIPSSFTRSTFTP
jgi:hypothetical protein